MMMEQSVLFTSSPSEGFADEGSDTLTSIEKMQFSDKTLSKTSLKYQLSKQLMHPKIFYQHIPKMYSPEL